MDHLQVLGKNTCAFCGEQLSGKPPFVSCQRLSCKLKQQQEASRKSQQRLRDRERRLEQDKIAAQQRYMDGQEQADVALASVEVPHYHPGTESVDDERIARFEDHLRTLLSSLARVNEEKKYRSPNGVTKPHQLDSVLQKACASCNGKCCRLGEQHHAFIQRDTLLRVLHEVEGLDEDSLIALYLSFIPDVANKSSCVYHSVHGCCLPDTLRADICGEFFCLTLDEYIDKYHDKPQPQKTMVFSVLEHEIKTVKVVSCSGELEALPADP